MIHCPACGKANADGAGGRRHCNWCGCYLPPLLHEDDATITHEFDPLMALEYRRIETLRMMMERQEMETARARHVLSAPEYRFMCAMLETEDWLRSGG